MHGALPVSGAARAPRPAARAKPRRVGVHRPERRPGRRRAADRRGQRRRRRRSRRTRCRSNRARATWFGEQGEDPRRRGDVRRRRLRAAVHGPPAAAADGWRPRRRHGKAPLTRIGVCTDDRAFVLRRAAGSRGGRCQAGTLTSDDSSDARAHPPLAERAAAHPRHARADGGGVRPRRLLRLLAVSRPPHHPGGRARLPPQSQPGGGPARRLLEPAVDHRRRTTRSTTMLGAAILRTRLPPGFRERLADLFELSVLQSGFWRELCPAADAASLAVSRSGRSSAPSSWRRRLIRWRSRSSTAASIYRKSSTTSRRA